MRRNTEALRTGLEDARREIMGPLAAAAMESYSRAYPLLVKLHMVQVRRLRLRWLHAASQAALPDGLRPRLLHALRKCQARGRHRLACGC